MIDSGNLPRQAWVVCDMDQAALRSRAFVFAITQKSNVARAAFWLPAGGVALVFSPPDL
jgi:hypothetical protein